MNPLHSRPIDRVARRVVFGEADHYEAPCKASKVYDTLPPMLSLAQAHAVRPVFTNLTGMTLGQLKVLGVSTYRLNDPASVIRWVCQCKCSRYVIRRPEAILKQCSPDAACAACEKKRRMRNRELREQVYRKGLS